MAGEIIGMDARAVAMRMQQEAREAQMRQESTAIASICTQIVVNRDKLCGEHGSAASDAIVTAADRILLAWFNGLTEETKK